MFVAVVVVAGCSSDSGEGASSESTPSATRPPALSPSVATGTTGTGGQPSAAPTPLPSSAYPPLAGFGEVHDIGSVVGISDSAGGTVLSFDRSAYVLCTPSPGDAESCLDGYRIDDVEATTRDYVVTPTVKVTLWVQPEEYETGDLTDLREFVATHPSTLVILQLDAAGRVIAVGQPWLP